jgi:mannosyltransferase
MRPMQSRFFPSSGDPQGPFLLHLEKPELATAKADAGGLTGRGAERHHFLLLTIGVAATLSFYSIAAKSVWLDEASSINLARLDWRGMWLVITTQEANMALYHLLLHFWLRFGADEFAVRSLSAILAVAAIAPVYGIGTRLFGSNTGLIASLLLTVNAFFICYAQEARAYSLFLLLVAGSSYLFLRAIDTPSGKNWAIYVIVGALSMYAHFFGVWVIAAHFVAAMVFGKGLVRRRDLIVSHSFIALLASPLLVPILTPGSHSNHIGWLAKPSLRTLAGLFEPLTGYGGPVLVLVYAVVCGYALLYAATHRRTPGVRFIPWRYAFLVTWLFLPVLGSFLFSILLKPIFLPRYLIISLPPLVLIAATGVQHIRPVWLKLTILMLILALSTPGLFALYIGQGPFQKEDWRAATKYVLDNSEAGDGIVFKAPFVRRPFEYYLQLLGSQSHAPEPVFPSAPWGEYDLSSPNKELLPHRSQPYPRLWLVLSFDFPPKPISRDGSGWLPDKIKSRYCLTHERAFSLIRVVLYQVCP